MEDEAILKDQTFELIYAQSSYLYMILPHVSHFIIELAPDMSHIAYGIIGILSNQPSQTKSSEYPTSYASPTPSPPFVTTQQQNGNPLPTSIEMVTQSMIYGGQLAYMPQPPTLQYYPNTGSFLWSPQSSMNLV